MSLARIPLRRRIVAVTLVWVSSGVAFYLSVIGDPLNSLVAFLAAQIPSVVGIACTIWLFSMHKSVRGLIFAIFMVGCLLAVIAMGIQQRSRSVTHYRETMANLYAGFEADQLKQAKAVEARAKGESDADLASLLRKEAATYRNEAGKYHGLSETYKRTNPTPVSPTSTAPPTR